MKKVKLISVNTHAPEKFQKETIKRETLKLKLKLEELQNLLYAS